MGDESCDRKGADEPPPAIIEKRRHSFPDIRCELWVIDDYVAELLDDIPFAGICVSNELKKGLLVQVCLALPDSNQQPLIDGSQNGLAMLLQASIDIGLAVAAIDIFLAVFHQHSHVHDGTPVIVYYKLTPNQI